MNRGIQTRPSLSHLGVRHVPLSADRVHDGRLGNAANRRPFGGGTIESPARKETTRNAAGDAGKTAADRRESTRVADRPAVAKPAKRLRHQDRKAGYGIR